MSERTDPAHGRPDGSMHNSTLEDRPDGSPDSTLDGRPDGTRHSTLDGTSDGRPHSTLDGAPASTLDGTTDTVVALPPVNSRQSGTHSRAPQHPAPDRLWREVLGEEIRRERTARQERLKDTAERAGISPQYLSELERGMKDPSSEMVEAVAGALGKSSFELTRSAVRSWGATVSVDLRPIHPTRVGITQRGDGVGVAQPSSGCAMPTAPATTAPVLTSSAPTAFAPTAFAPTAPAPTAFAPTAPASGERTVDAPGNATLMLAA